MAQQVAVSATMPTHRKILQQLSIKSRPMFVDFLSQSLSRVPPDFGTPAGRIRRVPTSSRKRLSHGKLSQETPPFSDPSYAFSFVSCQIPYRIASQSCEREVDGSQ